MAFRGCAWLKKVIFQDESALEKLGNDCFRESGLKDFTVPKFVEMVGERAFQDCTALQVISFCADSQLKVIGVDAFRASGLVSFTTPESLRLLAQGAFFACKRLKCVELNDDLNMLGVDMGPERWKEYDGVFQNSALENVRLPPKLKKITPLAFAGCRKLTRI